MIAPRRVVIVLQAEKLFEPRKKRKAAEPDSDEDESGGSLEPLVDYLADPLPDDGPGVRLLEPRGRQEPGGHPAGEEPEGHKGAVKAATIVVCTGLDGGKDPGRWIEQQATAAGLTVDRPVIARILQVSGGDTGQAPSRRRKAAVVCRWSRTPDAGACRGGCGCARAPLRRLGAGQRRSTRRRGGGTSRAEGRAGRGRQRRAVSDSGTAWGCRPKSERENAISHPTGAGGRRRPAANGPRPEVLGRRPAGATRAPGSGAVWVRRVRAKAA